jgi:hypothetical protein
MHEHLGRPLAVVTDVVGVGVWGMSFLGYLPETVATLASFAVFLWYMAQFLESKTGRCVIGHIRCLFGGSDD